MAAVWLLLVQFVFLLCAGSALALAGWLLARRGRRGPAAAGEAAALTLTACWALASFGLGSAAPAAAMLVSLTQFAWLWSLYRLFAHDEHPDRRRAGGRWLGVGGLAEEEISGEEHGGHDSADDANLLRHRAAVKPDPERFARVSVWTCAARHEVSAFSAARSRDPPCLREI